MNSSYRQDFDQIYDPSFTPTETMLNPQSQWTTVFPILLRTIIKEGSLRYSDTLVYIASSEELAEDWCKRNTDIEVHNEDQWWWFIVNREAIDGEYSGIKGVANMFDWDGNPIMYQPLDGYNRKDKEEDGN